MGWTHIEDKIVKARTRHRCWLCGETINWGEHYLRRVGIERGYGKVTAKMHPECEAETRDWDAMEWESFSTLAGEFKRPKKSNQDEQIGYRESLQELENSRERRDA